MEKICRPCGETLEPKLHKDELRAQMRRVREVKGGEEGEIEGVCSFNMIK